MITGLYSAWADSVPLLFVTGQAPVAKLHKEDFQAVDIAAIAAPVTKLAVTVLEPRAGARRVPAGVPRHALGPARAGAARPAAGRAAGRDRLRHRDLPSRCRSPGPAATRAQAEKALDLLAAAHRPLIVAGGGIVNADDAADLLVQLAEILDVPVIPTLMGWGTIPDDHRLMAGHGRDPDLPPVRQRHHARRRTSSSASATAGPTGTPAAWTSTAPAVPSCTSTSSRPRSAGSSPPTTASSPTRRPRWSGWSVARSAPGRPAAGLPGVGRAVRRAQADPAPAYRLRRRADQAAAGLPGDEPGVRPRHPLRQHHRPVPDRRRAVPARLPAAALDQRRPGRAARLDRAGRARRGVADPDATVVGLSGDYDFQFLVEELAGGAQFKLPVRAGRGEQLLPRADPAGAARLRHGLLRPARVRQRQLPRAGRVRRRPRQGRRRLGLQGDPGARAGRAAGARSRRRAADGRVPGAGRASR